MKEKDVVILNQLVNSLKEAIPKLEEAHGKKDFVSFTNSKKLISNIQKKISEIKETGIPIFRKKFLQSSVPEKIHDTVYIVSLIVAQSFPDRDDFLIVNDTIRDEKGRIIGARSFAQI